MDAVTLKFVDCDKRNSERCPNCLFCLKSNIVDADQDNGHEDCALEQTENGFPDSLNCWSWNENGKAEKYGYWTI